MNTEILSYLVAAYLAFILGTLSPGPNVLAILETAFRKGRSHAIAVGLGMASGSLIWGISSIVGLTLAVLSVPYLIRALQISAACYLFWLAYKAFRAMHRMQANATTITNSTNLIKYYVQGLLIQITNPKSAITWLVVYSLAISETDNVLIGYYVIVGNVLLSVVIHISYAILFSLPQARAFYLKNRKWIQCVIGILFCVLATIMLFSRTIFNGVM